MSHAEKDALVLRLFDAQQAYARKLKDLERKTEALQSKSINGPLWLSIALSIIAHILFSVFYHGHHEKPKPLLAEKGEKRIEISLMDLPPAKLAGPATEPQTQPPAKPTQPLQPATKPKPVNKPVKKPPVEAPTKIVKRPPPIKEKPVEEFRDEFAYKSHSFSSNMPSGGGTENYAGGFTAPDGGLSPGTIVNVNPKIIYPRQAMRLGYQGVVVVLIHIATDGRTNGVDLLQSSGHTELDDQVLGAVQHWRFSPPMRGNAPVEGVYKHTVVFSANDEVIDANDFDRHWREMKVMPAAQ